MIYLALTFGALAKFLDANDAAYYPKVLGQFAPCCFALWIVFPHNLPVQDALVVTTIATLAALNIIRGGTEWKDMRRNSLRYFLGLNAKTWVPMSLGTVGPGLITFFYFGLVGGLIYSVFGLCLGPIYYYLQQHKPQWVSDIVGNRDIASIPAGALLLGGLIILGV